MNNQLRGIIRLVKFLISTSKQVHPLVFNRRYRGDFSEAGHRLQCLTARLVDMFGVEVEVEGSPPDEPVLFVSNHRSYFDGAVLSSLTGSFFVIKSDVAEWPLIGSAVKATENILVNRNNKFSRASSGRKIRNRIKSGYSVTIFAEGTTYRGPGFRNAYPGAFKLSARTGIPLVPVVVEYENPGDAWVNDDGFIRHFIKCFGKPRTKVKVVFGKQRASTDPAFLKNEISEFIDLNSRRVFKEFELMRSIQKTKEERAGKFSLFGVQHVFKRA